MSREPPKPEEDVDKVAGVVLRLTFLLWQDLSTISPLPSKGTHDNMYKSQSCFAVRNFKFPRLPLPLCSTSLDGTR
jgi:hypothetical protein